MKLGYFALTMFFLIAFGSANFIEIGQREKQNSDIP